MIIDCHVHTSACTPGHGSMSGRLLRSFPMRFARWRLGLGLSSRADAQVECALAARLAAAVNGTREIDAAVILAFDAVYRPDGMRDEANTHLYVTNDYVIELARGNSRFLFGASVHPYRTDAVEELERCVAAGAVLVKWLPLTQGFNPADERCIPFYEALAHYRVPLLSHTGWEQALPMIDKTVASPMLLEPALKRGVTVIAAHCGTRAMPWQQDFLPEFMDLARRYERMYGDTSALNLPSRSYAYDAALRDPVVRTKLVHGSDWPIIPLPPVSKVGPGEALALMGERNWMRRDVLIKRKLDLDEAYWHRAEKILRLPGERGATAPAARDPAAASAAAPGFRHRP
jgi:predicted TIM-barrel fold metal-dependent hydrolase